MKSSKSIAKPIRARRLTANELNFGNHRQKSTSVGSPSSAEVVKPTSLLAIVLLALGPSTAFNHLYHDIGNHISCVHSWARLARNHYRSSYFEMLGVEHRAVEWAASLRKSPQSNKLLPISSHLLKSFGREERFSYLPSRYNFTDSIRQFLFSNFDYVVPNLEEVHWHYLNDHNFSQSLPAWFIPPALEKAELLAGFRTKKNKKKEIGIPWHLNNKWEQGNAWLKFLASYTSFVQQEIAVKSNFRTGQTDMGSSDTPLLGVLFQDLPILRVIFPQSKSSPTRVHEDAEYYDHMDASLLERFQNFWVPLSNVTRHNTLYVESQPGEGDYHPLENMREGEAVRFWGMRCRHFAVTPNASAQSVQSVQQSDLESGAMEVPMMTRVSFDFRALPIYRRTCDSDNRTVDDDSQFFSSSWLVRRKVEHELKRHRHVVDVMSLAEDGDSFDRFFCSVDPNLLEQKLFRLEHRRLGVFRFIRA